MDTNNPNNPEQATILPSPPPVLNPTPVEEVIIESLDAIQSKQEAQDEKMEELLNRMEDLQIKLEDIEANMIYPSYPGTSE